MSGAPLIEISGLRVTFHGDRGRVTHAIDQVDLNVLRSGPRSVSSANPVAARA